jgi:septal ring factor EnvC (AmiA/AmiB activator)
MLRTSIAAGVLVVGIALLAVDQSFSQDKADQATVVKGKLPKNYSKLGLTDEQRQKIFAIGADYNTKIAGLKKQIKTLQDQEKVDVEKVLTDDQKTALRNIILQSAPKTGGGDAKK